MLSHKLQTAVFAATLCSFFFATVFPLNTSGIEVSDRYTFTYMLRGFQIYTPFIFVGTFLFGVPVSMIADQIAGRIRPLPSFVSFGLHILACALLSVFFLEPMAIFIYASIVAIVFSIVYQWIKERNFSGASMFLFFAMLILWTISLSLTF